MIRRGIPPSSMNILLNSLSENSHKQYEGCYKKWFIYCNENKLNMYEVSIPNVMNFLTLAYNGGAQYGTLNSYRSALSLISKENISGNEDIKRFFKGVFRSRPPLPKYNETWDTSLVLNNLEKWYPNQELSLEKITKKLVTLLALVTAHRVQTLSKIKICNIERFPKEIKIKIPDLIKTSRIGASQPMLIIPFFDKKPEICPAQVILTYLEMTEGLRINTDTLFISFKKPHKSVGAQTLSRWIKHTLSLSGIDTSTFTAHSTRHAATSAAQRLGVNIDQIRRAAGWSHNSQAFAKFYNRPVNDNVSNDCFGMAIMNDSINKQTV